MTRKTKAKFNKLMRLHEKRYKLFLKYEPLEEMMGHLDADSRQYEAVVDQIVPIEGMMQELTNEIESICDDLINMAE
jgi:hypothetical protein